MTQVSEIMSTDLQTVEPQESLRQAAEMMEELDIGALPVCDGDRLLGMVTDRDITIRAVAQGLDTETTTVSDIMSEDIEFVTEDQDVEAVMRMMSDAQVRRMPVVDEQQNLVGIVSLADLALRQPGHVDATLREISQPGNRSSL